MNQNLRKLRGIAQKEKRKIIGLMSGTSLDGLDIALCEISGSGIETKFDVKEFVTKNYTPDVQKRLKKISSVPSVELRELCYQHRWLALLHSKYIAEALTDWSIDRNEVDAIGSHGQTIYHYPAQDQSETPEPYHSTLQIGDSDTIAVETGIVTIGDFRQKHIAHGGEGAPMAEFVDSLLFRDENKSQVLLNIGGIANYTYLPAGYEEKFTADVGPGNTLIDRLTQIHFGEPFDKDGKIAKSGQVQMDLLKALESDKWFAEENSTSTGPEYFNIEWIKRISKTSGIDLDELDPRDVIATVTELSGKIIAEHIAKKTKGAVNRVVYVSGGGAHNPALIGTIRKRLDSIPVVDFNKLGVNPDAKEAIIFAVLANETLAGDGFSFRDQSGTEKMIQFGKISFPV